MFSAIICIIRLSKAERSNGQSTRKELKTINYYSAKFQFTLVYSNYFMCENEINKYLKHHTQAKISNSFHSVGHTLLGLVS